MRKRLFLAGLGLALALTLGVATSRAEGPVRVLESRQNYTFGEVLSFRLVAESDQEIKAVTLYYRRQKERVTSRVVPDFQPGRRVEASYDKELEPGEIPPGTTMEYYWRLELADGTQSDTPTQAFVCDDHRFDWQTLHADNLTLYYYGNERDERLAQGLLQAGQEALVRLQSEVGVELEAPVSVYVYRTSEDMSGALASRSDGFDERIVTLGVAVSDDTLLLLGSHPDAQQTIAHELSHIVVGLATKNPYAPLPRWLDEGLAMYAEGELPARNINALNDAVSRDALISVRSLSSYTGDASQVDLYYGEVYSLVDYLLRTYGREKMRELLAVFGQGAYQEDALREVYGLGLDELDAAWRESLGLKPRVAPNPASTAAPPAQQKTRGRQACPLASFAGALSVLATFGLKRATRFG